MKSKPVHGELKAVHYATDRFSVLYMTVPNRSCTHRMLVLIGIHVEYLGIFDWRLTQYSPCGSTQNLEVRP